MHPSTLALVMLSHTHTPTPEMHITGIPFRRINWRIIILIVIEAIVCYCEVINRRGALKIYDMSPPIANGESPPHAIQQNENKMDILPTISHPESV